MYTRVCIYSFATSHMKRSSIRDCAANSVGLIPAIVNPVRWTTASQKALLTAELTNTRDEALRILEPDSGAYVNEVSNFFSFSPFSPFLYWTTFQPRVVDSRFKCLHRPTPMNQTGKKPSGALIIRVSFGLRSGGIQWACFIVFLVWVQNNGKSMIQGSYVENEIS